MADEQKPLKLMVALEVERKGEEVAEDDFHISNEQLELSVDAAIAAFDDHFQTLGENGNAPLVRGERAIIKTFLHYHLVHLPKVASEAPADQRA